MTDDVALLEIRESGPADLAALRALYPAAFPDEELLARRPRARVCNPPRARVRREAWEEARARIEIDAFLAVYNIPHISQVQLMYRARLKSRQ